MSYNYALRPGTTQKLNTNNSSTASAAFGSQTEYIRVVGDANCHFVLGAHPDIAQRIANRGVKQEIFSAISSIKLFAKSWF